MRKEILNPEKKSNLVQTFKRLITPPILFLLQTLSIFLIYLNSFPLILIFKAINSSPK